MANLVTPKSYNQILSEMLSAYMARIGVNDLQTGSAVTSFFEAVAQSVFRSSGDIFQIIRDFSVDRAQGEALKRIAIEERVNPIPAQVATGTVTIRDTSFQKISTKVYAGDVAPNIGSTKIKVSDASLFPASGQLYIGRGTPNVEGPIAYNAVTPVGSFYEITLVNPTTKYHNISESVILSQGGVRNVAINTGVKTIGTGGAEDISFVTTKSIIILDGENEVTNVPVAALKPSTDGNIPRNAIKEFVIEPFSGATVFNDVPFTTGKNEESDDELRARIKRARISRGLGTALSVKNSTLGAVAKDESATVTSNEIFSADDTILYIDNGNGYEEKSTGVGLEPIVDSALGGEVYFQLATGGSQTSVAKAFLESVEDGPFQLYNNDRLSILVGGVESEHVFLEGDFRSQGSVTAYEIVSSINANSNLLFSARTSNNGKKVVIFAKSETNEYLQVSTPAIGIDASINMFLPRNRVDTLKLYKNKTLLQKDGVPAFIQSAEQNSWSNTLASGETLILKVDNTQFITYTFTDSDFLNEGTYTSLNKNNSVDSWANVFNNKIIGATATVSGTRLVITSNLGSNSRAAIEIDPLSSFVSKGIFPSTESLASIGQESDYTISRNTAQIKLKKPLASGDSLAAGSDFTRAFVQSLPILGGTVTLTADSYLWFIVDDSKAKLIRSGMVTDTLLDISKPSTNIIRYTSNQPSAFINVQVGDYFIAWSEEINVNNRLEARVHNVTSTYIDIKVTAAEFALAQIENTIVVKDGFVFIRTDKTPQKIKIIAGAYNINQISNLISENVIGASSSVDNDEILIVSSETEGLDGSIFIPTFNTAAKMLNFNLGSTSNSGESLFAFFQSQETDHSFPLFQHGYVVDEQYADTPDSTIPSFQSSISPTLDPNVIVKMLHPYSLKDAQAAGENTQVSYYSGNNVFISPDQLIRRLRTNDRFYFASPYDFGHEDSLVVTLDLDSVNKTFQVPFYRKMKANATAPISVNNFRAYDIESGPLADINQYFPNFDFTNYKVLMRARNAITPKSNTVDQDSVLFRSSVWGAAGEKYRVGYFYPVSPNSALSHTITVSDKVDVKIYLKSGNPVVNAVDSSTEWNITVVPNIPAVGMEEVTYVWNGTGTNPALVSLNAGDYVTINSNGEFSPENQGTFKIITATSTAFVIHRKIGSAIAESGVATLTPTTISFFQNDDTTAQEINDYVNTNVSNFIESELLNDNGTTGSGIIDLSTYDDIGFEYVELKDGINWILQSDVAAIAPAAQFIFKKNLELASINTATANAYSFNNGEDFRIIPTTAKQVQEFVSVLAVSGITTLGRVENSNNDQNVQILSSILGSQGAVQIAGGSGVNPSSPLTASASKSGDKMLLTVDRSSSAGIESGYVKIQAQNLQRKDTGISVTTNVTIIPNSPVSGKSKVILENKEPEDLYFGAPKTGMSILNKKFAVEKHGKFVCISWDGNGSAPNFTKLVDVKNVTSNMSVFKNTNTGFTEYSTTVRNFSGCQKGDVFTVNGFANPQNNGTFNVIGVKNGGLTIIVDNLLGINEASISITSANLSVISEIGEGDTVILGEPFSTLNRGTFRIIKRFDQSFYIENTSAVEEEVLVTGNAIAIGGDSTTEYNIFKNGNRVKLQYNGNGTAPSFANIKVGQYVTLTSPNFASSNQGQFLIVSVGSDYIEFYNVNAVNEFSLLATSSIQVSTCNMTFYSYDSTLAGDSFDITGDSLGALNIGTYKISEVVDDTTIVVDGILSPAGSVSLGNDFLEVMVTESIPYSGYKKLHTVSVDPASEDNLIMVFDSNKLFQKINDSAGIVISGTSKVTLPQSLIKGTDSYRFNTGLIAEVNKILYGDPRDTSTYPGVSAAGAEIFVQAPLFRRITVSINVRVNTGIPFARVTEQVRNNISALINSSPIGKSIAISDIITTVNSISGVSAVSISSPQYSPTSDVIVINPAEKALILNPIEDVVVSKVGN